MGMRAGGVEDIKNHPWFEGIDWVKLKDKKYSLPNKPPFEAENARRRGPQRGHCMDEWAAFHAAAGNKQPGKNSSRPIGGRGKGALKLAAEQYNGPQDCFAPFSEWTPRT